MVRFSNGPIVLDNAVSTAKIQDNAVTQAKMADNSVGTAEIIAGSVTGSKLDTATIPIPVLIASGSFSAASSVDIQSLTAYEEYILELDLTSSSGADVGLGLTINNDTASHYNYTQLTSLVVQSGNDTKLSLTAINSDKRTIGEVIIGGKTNSTGDGRLGVRNNLLGHGGANTLIVGSWVAGTINTQVDRLTLTPTAGTITGNYNVYGKNI